MKKLRIGINGFGRIGRNATRIILGRPDVEIVAINSRAGASSHAYLLKYDSSYGILNAEVKVVGEDITVNNQRISVFNFDNPAEIPWKKVQVDLVIDATGKFRTTEDLKGHLTAGAKYVVLSAPAKDSTKTLVLGVNHTDFEPEIDKIISNSSCTTNCLATTVKVMHKNFQILSGFMTTIHAVTDSQNLLDNSHKKEVRLRRASFASMIPAATGSAKDIGKLFPELDGRIICQAIRVPLLTVSIINLTIKLAKSTTVEKINNSFLLASKNGMRGIISVANDELVSKDFTGNTHSAIIDPYLTKIIDNDYANVYAWYDNEWGYTNRLVDMVSFVGKKSGLI